MTADLVRLPPYTLAHGASWLTREGDILVVPGFHEEWLREHADLTEGSRNVCELVLRKRWISVALFDGGYLELMVPDRDSPEVLAMLGELLRRNAGLWSQALVMSMDEEGYAILKPGDVADESALREKLAAGCC